MPEMGRSGLMSGDGKRGGARRQYPRPSSTLPAAGFSRLLFALCDARFQILCHTPPQSAPGSEVQALDPARKHSVLVEGRDVVGAVEYVIMRQGGPMAVFPVLESRSVAKTAP